MEVQIIIGLAVLFLAFGVLYFRTRKRFAEELIRQREQVAVLDEEHSNYKKKSEVLEKQLSDRVQIFEAISMAMQSTTMNEEGVFERSMFELAGVLRTVFKSEYCAIGKRTIKTGKPYFEDFAMHYALKASKDERMKQMDAADKVKIVDNHDPGYFIITALQEEKILQSFNKSDIESKRKENKHFVYYEKDILASGRIENTTVINIFDAETVGYIQFINTKSTILDSDFEPFLKNLAQLIQFSVTEKENRQFKLQKEQLTADVEFIMTSIKNDLTDFDRMLKGIMSYFARNFGAAIVSFRIPILNGKERAAYFYLRSHFVDEKLSNKDAIERHYRDVELLDYTQLGSHEKLKCYLPDEFFIGEPSDLKFSEKQDSPMNRKECVILPVFKEMHPFICFNNKEHQCNIHDNLGCKAKYQNLFGDFRLRVYQKTNIHDAHYQHRLKTFSSLLNFLFDAIMDKNDAAKIKEFQDEIKNIDFKTGDDFEQRIVEILCKVTRSKVCSIYWHRNDYRGDYFQLGATTSTHRFHFGNQIVEEIESVKNLWTVLNDGQNILSKAFQSKKSKYLYNLKDSLGSNKAHHLLIFPEFVELPGDIKTDVAFEFITKESVFAIPIWSKNQNIKGVVLLVGKMQNPTTISKSFWEQDRLLIELFANIISRFIDAHEADKEREKFLHQLGHELLAPITEIVYENNSLLNRYKSDKTIGKDVAFQQLKDNMNAAMYFKHIVDDVQFDHGREAGNKYNMELVVKPKELILGIVQLFEKRAHAEKQISIRTNISEIPPINMDKLRIQQVVINLLKNAIQYSHDNTIIDIYYKVVDAVVDGYPSQKWHEIVVVNYGIGIPESDKDAVFGLYSRSQNAITVRPQGTGIGLYIVKTIMRAHQGDCLIKRLSNPTEIAIYLPFNNLKNK